MFAGRKESERRKKDKKRPVVFFSHGFTIAGDREKGEKGVIEGSGYSTMVKESLRDAIFIALNHRGSRTHREKADYSLADREEDMLAIINATLTEGGLIDQLDEEDASWNGEVYLMGDSVGGHVIASLARNLTEIDGLILVEPSANSHQTHHMNLVTPDHKF